MSLGTFKDMEMYLCHDLLCLWFEDHTDVHLDKWIYPRKHLSCSGIACIDTNSAGLKSLLS
jgi:hypothetical protein